MRPLTGEFRDRELEAAFRAERFGETQRHVRLLLAAAALLNLLLMLFDPDLHARPDQPLHLALRGLLLVATIGSFHFAGRVSRAADLEHILVAWQWITTACLAGLLYFNGNVTVPIGFVLPALFYLAVPVPFRWRLVNGIGASLVLTLAHEGLPPAQHDLLLELLGLALLNGVLIVLVQRDNRTSRASWSARQAEREALDQSAQASELLDKTFLATPIPLVITDMQTGEIIRYNDAGVRYFGGTPEVFGIRSTDQIYACPDDRQRFIQMLREHGQITNCETRIRLGNGEIRTVLVGATAIDMAGRSCLLAGVVDITDHMAAEQRARHAALHDVLTGLPNRAAFQNALEAAYAGGGPVCLLLIDLDSLKDVNDTFGHDVGDALLVEAGRRLEQLVKDRGTVARLGGDEFVVLLGEGSLEAATELAQLIVTEFRRPMLQRGRPLFTKASVGIALRAAADGAPGELLKDADLALYAAKRQGRNRAVVYSPTMRQAMKERVSLHRALTDAAAAEAIIPFYQPKVSLITGRIVGFEALMRWRQGPQAFLAPGAFGLAFQDPELAVLIGDSMMRQVAADVRRWTEAGVDFGRMALNLSPAQFTHLDLGTHLLNRFAEAGVAPELFEVEVTETVFLGRRVEHVAPILRQFYEAGVRVALDDFGTGYAALTHLKQLPIDTIKIDQSFIEDIEGDTFDAAIVTSVLDLGRTLDMQVVAEGVETLGQARFLAANGCEIVQGFLYARPMPADQVAEMLARECDAVAADRLRALSATA
ncbi:putative bifunctional diguanylate cyclase/phosphodiesterase [Xanthobacteraceae bacterium A53D]